jgi:hypothetical protein
MNYNPNLKTTHYFVSEEDMMLTQNANWDVNGDYGKGDAIGRSCEAYMCYQDLRFIEAIKKCWLKIEKEDGSYYYRPQRYPTSDYYEKDFSRDHTISTFTALKWAGEEETIKEIGNNIRFIFRKKNKLKNKVVNHKFTLGLWFWVKALTGKWWATPLFYLVTYIEVLLYMLLNPICYLMGNFGKEMTTEDYIAADLKALKENTKRPKRQFATKWQQFWAKLHFPAFGIHKLSWQIMVMKKSFFKCLLEKMALTLVPRYNYLLKLNLGSKKVNKTDILNCKTTGGTRWTTTLNITNDRDVRFLTDPKLTEANNQDIDILKAMWNHLHPKDKIEV